MKTLIFALSALFLFSALSNAQTKKPDRIFGKKQTDILLSVGVLPTSALLDGAAIKMLPLTFQAQRFLGNNFSLGVSYGYSSFQSKPMVISDGIAQRVTNQTHQIGLKGAFHVTRLDNWDIYGGFMLAMHREKFKVNVGNFDFLQEHKGMKPENTKMTYTGFVGILHAFSKRITAFAEAGFHASIINLGVGYQL